MHYLTAAGTADDIIWRTVNAKLGVISSAVGDGAGRSADGSLFGDMQVVQRLGEAMGRAAAAAAVPAAAAGEEVEILDVEEEEEEAPRQRKSQRAAARAPPVAQDPTLSEASTQRGSDSDSDSESESESSASEESSGAEESEVDLTSD